MEAAVPFPADAIAAPSSDLALGFANTLAWRGSGAPVESLNGIDELLAWLAGNAGLAAPAAEMLRRWAADYTNAAAGLFAEAIALRETIYALATAVIVGQPAGAADLARFNAALSAAPTRTRLVAVQRGYAWAAAPVANSAAALLAPVLWSAADLLAGPDRLQLRRCANDRCLWLFVDRSKAGTRRWCDMTSCGNRAKARRHYDRVRPGAARRDGE